jgi:hypothetical protein
MLSQVVLHPRWGTAFYPASIFTQAPVDHILEALKVVYDDARLAVGGE